MQRLIMGTLIGIGVIAASACGGRSWGRPLPQHRVAGPSNVDAGAGPLTRAHMSVVATLRDRAVGPLLARGDEGSLVAYVGGAAGVRPVVVIALGPDGAPRNAGRTVAQAPADTSALVIRHLMNPSGYVVAWTSLTDRGESLNVVGVSETGEPHGSAVELARTPEHVAWVDIVATPHGAVCVWAEEPPEGTANVLTQALDTNGKPHGVPSRVLRGATGWQTLASNGGVALAIVSPGAKEKSKPPEPNTLSLARLDAEGRLVGEPLSVARGVGADMDMVHITSDDSLVFAWTDRTHVDAQVTLATVDAQNKVGAPHDAVPDAGASSLVGIAGGSNGALVLWEAFRKREHARRRVQAGLVRSGVFEPRTTLDLVGGAAIEARAVGDGFALLVMAKACAEAGACGGPAPTFLRLDGALAPVQSEAFVQGPAVSFAWSLECGKSCIALAAGTDAPTSVYAVDLGERASTHVAPLAPALPPDAPRLLATTTLSTATQVTDLAAAHVGETTLAAALVSTGAGDKTHQERTALRVTPITAGKLGTPVTLNTRALPTGGVALVAGAVDAAIAYVARDTANTRVHLARIDAKAATKWDVAVSGTTGDASDVSVAAVDGGFIVAWVDTRDGNGEVYVARVTSEGRAGPNQRVTNAPGDATDTALAVGTNNVILAWADPRESPRDGFADIYAVALSSKDAKPLGKEGRILSTAAHSRSPSVTHTPTGVALAWIEEAPAGAASDEARGAMFTILDDNARPARDPYKVKLRDGGVVTAIALDAHATTRLLHAVVARTRDDDLWLDSVRLPLDTTGVPESYPLIALDGPSSLDVALHLEGEELFFSDDGPDAADSRVRRGLLGWQKN